MSITIIIVLITCTVSLAAFQRKDAMYKLKFIPTVIQSNKEWHRFFTYALVHADIPHLCINMFVLYSFGEVVDHFYSDYFGSKSLLYFILLYVGGTVTSVIPAYKKNKTHLWYSAVGASGATSAVVFTCILLNPMASMGFIFIPFHMPAIVFGLLYLGYSFYMAKKNSDNIGHDAHFFGALFGIMFTILLDRHIAVEFIKQIRLHFNT